MAETKDGFASRYVISEKQPSTRASDFSTYKIAVSLKTTFTTRASDCFYVMSCFWTDPQTAKRFKFVFFQPWKDVKVDVFSIWQDPQYMLPFWLSFNKFSLENIQY